MTTTNNTAAMAWALMFQSVVLCTTVASSQSVSTTTTANNQSTTVHALLASHFPRFSLSTSSTRDDFKRSLSDESNCQLRALPLRLHQVLVGSIEQAIGESTWTFAHRQCQSVDFDKSGIKLTESSLRTLQSLHHLSAVNGIWHGIEFVSVHNRTATGHLPNQSWSVTKNGEVLDFDPIRSVPESVLRKYPNNPKQFYLRTCGVRKWLVVVIANRYNSGLCVLSMGQQQFDLQQCGNQSSSNKTESLSQCNCIPLSGFGLQVGGYKCCCKNNPAVCLTGQALESNKDPRNAPSWTVLCSNDGPIRHELRTALLIFNSVCLVGAVVMAGAVRRKRTSQQQYGARGWALMELFLIGAAILYSIAIIEYVQPAKAALCCLVVWARELGFAIFYGAIVLKIYRNLIEYRVRKAHHVYVKEKDMLKYLACLVVLTITGLLAWTFGWQQAVVVTNNQTVMIKRIATTWHTPFYDICRPQLWAYAWQAYEVIFLLYGLWLCYRARNTTWVERWQFTVAVSLEILVSLTVTIVRAFLWRNAHPDTQMLISFLQVHLTVTVNIIVITLPKFYYISLDYPDRAPGISGGKKAADKLPRGMNPSSWHQIREKLENGTIDFATVPIQEMNPEDIRAELKRIYTQLRMYKMKNMYQDNPHISKRKGGKKSSDKERERVKNRRASNMSPVIQKRDADRKPRSDDDEPSCTLLPVAPRDTQVCTRVAPSVVVTVSDVHVPEHASVNDLTVESSPSNVWLARSTNNEFGGAAGSTSTATSNVNTDANDQQQQPQSYKLEPANSVRV